METVAKQKFNTGLKWIASSTMLVVISTGGWLSYDSMRNRSLEPLTVQSFTVKKDTVENLINESGIVELASQQTLKSPVTGGGIVERVLVQVGDRVKSGQILVMIRGRKGNHLPLLPVRTVRETFTSYVVFPFIAII